MSFSESLVGRTLGQYEIREVIGRGGMSAVYRAFQAKLERDVAIKILPESLAHQADFIERFNREVQVTARLEHPNIVPIYDYGIQDNITYIVMRLLPGGTLTDVLRDKGRVEIEPGLHLLEQIADALQYAHDRGIIHRDIKPSNVLLDVNGNPYLVDFGIARVAYSSVITDTGVVMGTPAYMSPEQFQSLPLGSQTDQYALGIMAYEMFTGEAPFKGDTPYALLMQAINEPLPSHNLLPDATYAVLAKATAKTAEDRYASVIEFVQALKTALSSSGTVAYENPRDYFKEGSFRFGVEDADRPTILEFATMATMYPTMIDVSTEQQSRSVIGILLFLTFVSAVIYIVVIGDNAEIAPFFAIMTGTLLAITGALWFYMRRTPAPVQKKSGTQVFRQSSRNYADGDTIIEGTLTVTKPPAGNGETPEVKESDSEPAPEKVKATPEEEKEASPSITFIDVKAGDKLGAYEIVERLDKGNRNRVYHALDTSMATKSEVAVKTIFTGTSRDNRAGRFRLETQILSRLHHAHIVPVFDHGAVNDMYYLVMPLMEQGTLRERIDKSAMPFDDVISIIRQICGAVDYMHGRGILHRDLKASNIMFGDEENAYLVDFGIAKIFGEEQKSEHRTQLTLAGDVVGTPAYMAPEQSMGAELTTAADLYAIGVLTFQMLTGKLPFEADSPYGLMIQHIRETPPLPSSIRSNIPSAVDDVILKVMDKQPENRYENGQSFAHALAKALKASDTNMPEKEETGHVFISYSRVDKDYARELAGYLREKTVPVWIDERINPSDSWWHTIDKAIDDSSVFVVIMSPAAEESRWVHKEILLADKRSKPAFPLLLDGDCFSIYVDTQYLDVTDQRMPTPGFINRLQRAMQKQ